MPLIFPTVHRALKLTLLTAFAALALLALACSSSSNDNNDSNPSTDGSPSSSSSGDLTAAQQELTKLAESWAKGTARVSYKMTGTGSNTADNGTMTLFWKYPRFRVDIAGGDGINVTIISNEQTTLFCSDEGEKQCISFGADSGLDLGGGDFTGLVDPDSLAQIATDVKDLKASSAKIAGQDARCFSGIDPQGGNGEICFSKSGVLLRIAGEDGEGRFTMEATEVNKDVPGNSFDAPYPVTDLSSIMGGIPTVTP